MWEITMPVLLYADALIVAVVASQHLRGCSGEDYEGGE